MGKGKPREVFSLSKIKQDRKVHRTPKIHFKYLKLADSVLGWKWMLAGGTYVSAWQPFTPWDPPGKAGFECTRKGTEYYLLSGPISS